MENMGKSAGNAEKEMATIQQSLEYKINALKETGTGISQNLFQREDIGVVISGLTKFLSIIDKLTGSLGLFGTIAVGGGITAFIKEFKTLGNIGDLTRTVTSLKELGTVFNALPFFKNGGMQTSFGGFRALSDTFKQMSEVDKGMEAFKSVSTIMRSFDGSSAQISALGNSLKGLSIESQSAILGLTKLSQEEMVLVLQASGLDSAMATETATLITAGTSAEVAAGGFASLGSAIAGVGVALLTNPLFLFMTALTGASLVIKKFKQSQQEANQAAKESSQGFAQSQESITNYSSRVQELSESLNSGTLSEQEAYEAKQELLSIQNELSESYGNQASGIDLLNGKLDEQINKIESLNKAEANSYLNKNADEIEKATNAMTKTIGGDGGWFKEAGTTIGTFSDNLSDESEKIKEIVDKYKENIFMDDLGSGEMRLRFVGDASDAQTVLNDFMSDIRNAQSTMDDTFDMDNLFSGAGEILKESDDIVAKYQDIYDAAQEAKLISDEALYSTDGSEQKTAATWLRDYTNAIQEYNEALASGDPTAISDAAENFNMVDGTINKLVASGGMGDYKNQIEEISGTLNKSAIAYNDFQNAIENGTDKGLKTATEGIKNAEMTISDFKDAFFFGDSADQATKDVRSVVQTAIDTGLVVANSIDDVTDDSLANLLSLLGDAGILVSEFGFSATNSLDNFKNQIKVAIESQTKLQTALKDSHSATGLTTDDIDNLTNSFKTLDNFDPKSLFEETATGVHLNREAFKLYSEELENVVKTDNLQNIINKEKELEEARKSGASSSIIQNLEEELEGFRLLANEYEGATSAYNAYVQATQAGNERDNFSNVAKGYKSIGTLIKQGWTTDETVTSYLDLLLGEERVKQIGNNEEAYKKLSKTIEGTSHSLKDYMTFDSDGNLTSNGVWTFVDDLATKFGDDMVTIGEDGSYALDLTGDKLQKVAKEFGTTTDFIELMGKALADAGMELNFDSEEVRNYQEEMQKYAESTNKAQKELADLQSKGGEVGDALSNIDFNYDRASMSIDDIDNKVSELTNKKNEIDISTDEGKNAVSLLENEIDALNNQKIMLQIGSALEGGSTVEELINLSDEDLQKTLNIDTSQVAEARKQLESLTSNAEEVPLTVKIDESQFAKLSKVDVEPEVVEQPQFDDTTVDVKPNVTEQPTFEDVTVNVKATGQTQVNDASAKVNYKLGSSPKSVPNATGKANFKLGDSPKKVPDADGKANYTLGTAPTKAPDITGTANYSVSLDKDTAPTLYGTAIYTPKVRNTGTLSTHPRSDGTLNKAYASGTLLNSYARGKVALDRNEQALVNEVGTESLIRNGVWQLIPGKPHIENLRKGDIILNAKQTADLLNKGKANSFGKAYANGTLLNAYSGYTGSGTRPTSTTSGAGSSSGTSGNNNGGSGSNKSNKNSTKDKNKDKTLFDYIERKLTYFANKVKSIADSITEYVSDSIRESKLKQERSAIKDQINVNNKAYSKYMEKANGVKLSSSIKKKIREGSLEIAEYSNDSETLKAINRYKEYYDNAQKCKDTVADLQKKQLDLFKDLVNIPIDSAKKKIDKLSASYETLSKKLATVSSGMSGVNALQKVGDSILNSARTTMESNKSAKTSAYNDYKSAKDATSKAKSKLTSKDKKVKKDKNGYYILSGLKKDSAQYKRLKAYNDALKKQNKAYSTYQAKKDAYNDSVDNYNNMNLAFNVSDSRKAEAKNQLDKDKKELDNAKTSYEASKSKTSQAKSQKSSTSADLSEASKTLNSAKSAKTSADKSLDSANKKLTKAKNALTKSDKKVKKDKNGYYILTGLSKKSAQYKRLKAYNDALKKQRDAKKKADKADANKKAAQTSYNKALSADNKAKEALDKAKSAQSSAKEELDSKQSDYNQSKSTYNSMIGGYKTTYEYQNELIDEEVKNKKKQNDANIKALEKANKNLSDAQSAKNSADKTKATKKKSLDSAKNALSKVKLSSSQKQSLANGKKISTKGLSGSSLKAVENYNKALEAYNKAAKEATAKSNELKIAQEAQATALENAAQSTAELALEQVEAEKSKFENIKTYYQAQLEYIDSVSERQQALNDLKEAEGKALTESDYNTLLKGVEDQIKNLQSESTALEKQLKDSVSKGIIVEGSEEWLEMQKEIEAVKTSTANAQKTQVEYNNAIINIPFESLERTLSLLDSIRSNHEAIANESQTLGNDLSLADYEKQLDDISEQIKYTTKQMDEANKNMLLAQSNGGYFGGKSYEEWQKEFLDFDTSIRNLRIDYEDLKDSMRDDVMWRSFERAHEECERFANTLNGIMDLYNDDMFFDSENRLTKYGMLEVANLVSTYESARKEVENYSNDIKNLNALYAEGFYTETEYVNKMSELQNSTLDYAKNMRTALESIVDMYKNMGQVELDNLLKVIDARNDALNKKKDYYEFDKSIKGKTKDIQSLEAQIAALEGIEGQEASAKRANLMAELSDAQSDLDDQVKDHLFDMSDQSFDELKNLLKDNFDDKWENLWNNLDDVLDILKSANDLTTSSAASINSTLNEILRFYGIDPVVTSIGEVAQYKSGTKGTKKDEIAWVNELGTELMVSPSDNAILAGIKKDTAVIPAGLTDNLFKWGELNPSDFASDLMKPLRGLKPISTGGTVVTQNYDNLINVEGNVDSTVISDMKSFTKELYKGAYSYTVREIARDARRNGIKV